MSDRGGKVECLEAELAGLRVRVDFLELERASTESQMSQLRELAQTQARALRNLLTLTETLCLSPQIPQAVRHRIASHVYVAAARAALARS